MMRRINGGDLNFRPFLSFHSWFDKQMPLNLLFQLILRSRLRALSYWNIIGPLFQLEYYSIDYCSGIQEAKESSLVRIGNLN